jgi:hypothetical protein
VVQCHQDGLDVVVVALGVVIAVIIAAIAAIAVGMLAMMVVVPIIVTTMLFQSAHAQVPIQIGKITPSLNYSTCKER